MRRLNPLYNFSTLGLTGYGRAVEIIIEPSKLPSENHVYLSARSAQPKRDWERREKPKHPKRKRR